MRRDIEFDGDGDGVVLRGGLYLPDAGAPSPHPTVMIAHGCSAVTGCTWTASPGRLPRRASRAREPRLRRRRRRAAAGIRSMAAGERVSRRPSPTRSRALRSIETASASGDRAAPAARSSLSGRSTCASSASSRRCCSATAMRAPARTSYQAFAGSSRPTACSAGPRRRCSPRATRRLPQLWRHATRGRPTDDVQPRRGTR